MAAGLVIVASRIVGQKRLLRGARRGARCGICYLTGKCRTARGFARAAIACDALRGDTRPLRARKAIAALRAPRAGGHASASKALGIIDTIACLRAGLAEIRLCAARRARRDEHDNQPAP